MFFYLSQSWCTTFEENIKYCLVCLFCNKEMKHNNAEAIWILWYYLQTHMVYEPVSTVPETKYNKSHHVIVINKKKVSPLICIRGWLWQCDEQCLASVLVVLTILHPTSEAVNSSHRTQMYLVMRRSGQLLEDFFFF